MREALGLLFAFIMIVAMFYAILQVSGLASDLNHIQSKYSNQVGG